ncbi:hypothetical protein TRFO_34742 [Tritrichomonas foetus]|uniref:Ubiquitin-like domain-containing protein n=1 Tax=Tritrichomonas foetus TaxID=1144522 RepID=A0A1J4JNR3_9EUKA|nr:hypothetical protein TRFO_34742 [Tritrichomonas foetus]|eukprot:OHS98908.1 hypothetical protein TRFO_34742 [Tritrichomonas foetus]
MNFFQKKNRQKFFSMNDTKLLYVQVVKSNLYEIEVTDDTSLEDARDFLIKNHNFSDDDTLLFRFIYRGKFLHNPNPFSTISPRSRLILYLQKIEPQDPIEEEEEEENDNNSQTHQFSNESFSRFVNSVTDITTNSFIESIYNPNNDIYRNTMETATIFDLFVNNESSQAIFYDFLLNHFSQVFRYHNIRPQTIFDIIGWGQAEGPSIVSDETVLIESLNTNQRELFEQLVEEFGRTQEETIRVYSENEFNLERTREALRRM